MEPFELTTDSFFIAIPVTGMVLLLLIFIPVQVVSKLRRMRKNYHRLTCRICGFRFLRRNPGIVECPHCGSKN